MAIIQATSSFTGFVGINPNFVFINTNDTIATVTTAGYLTNANREFLISVNSATMALVNTTSGVLWLSVQITGTAPNLIYSLIAPPYDGGAIFEGNVQAGSSGVAGGFLSYPGTASKGHLVVQATANTGNTVTTLSNNAMGQITAVNIPDPGNAIGQLLIGATATPFTSGHLVVASGTTGLVADAGFQIKSVAQKAVAGGAAAQTVTDAFCTTASMVVASWNDTSNAVEIETVAAGNGTFVVTSTGDPGASHLNYIITKV